MTGVRFAVLPLVLAVACGHGGGGGAGGPAVASRPAPEPPRPPQSTFHATAYSIEGRTAAGTRSRAGVVAADPEILPLGSRIRVSEAGQYSGEYVVEDTGRAIKGHELDLYLPNDREAQTFGRRRVQVEVLERGKGNRRAATP